MLDLRSICWRARMRGVLPPAPVWIRDFEPGDSDRISTMLVEDNLRRGMSPAEARRVARIASGRVIAILERIDIAKYAAFHSSRPCFRIFATPFRSLRRDAGFATFAILIVGLGIGASSTIFSVVNALFLRPLPLPAIPTASSGSRNPDDWWASGRPWRSPGDHFLDLRKRSQSFSDLAGYYTFFGIGRQLNSREMARPSVSAACRSPKTFSASSVSSRYSAGCSARKNASGTARQA